MLSKDDRIGWIDGLRALAIAGVIAVHCKGIATQGSIAGLEYLQYGQYGVQLFFLISTITTFETLKRSASRFEWMLKRLFRIAPLYYIGIALYAAMRTVEHVLSRAPHSEHPSVVDILSNVLFLNGWIPSANNSVVPGGWSIAVEITYYVVAATALRSAEKISKRAAVYAALTMGASILAINFAITGWMIKNNSFFYYWPIAQLPSFLLGYAVFRSAPSAPPPLFAKAVLLGLAAAGLWLCDFLGAKEAVVSFLVPTILTCTFWLIVISAGNYRDALSANWLTYTGRISYSMYIFHFIIVDTLRFSLNKLGIYIDNWPELLSIIALSASASAAVATVSYNFIEKPAARISKVIIGRIVGHRESYAS